MGLKPRKLGVERPRMSYKMGSRQGPDNVRPGRPWLILYEV